MKEQITRCYNLVADLLNGTYAEVECKRKLNEVYELLTEIILEMENGKS